MLAGILVLLTILVLARDLVEAQNLMLARILVLASELVRDQNLALASCQHVCTSTTPVQPADLWSAYSSEIRAPGS